MAPRKLCFHIEKASTERLSKTGSTHALASLILLPSPDAAVAYAYHLQRRGTPDAMADPGRRRPSQSVAEVLGTGRIPHAFAGALSAWFRLTGPDGTPLSTDGQKGGGINAFLVRLTAEAATVLRLAKLTLMGVNQDG